MDQKNELMSLYEIVEEAIDNSKGGVALVSVDLLKELLGIFDEFRALYEGLKEEGII